MKVAYASSLFKENGHDLKGIFNLLYNAIDSYVASRYIHSDVYRAYTSDTGLIIGSMMDAISKFHPNLEAAEARIVQFNQEYKELKEMSDKINDVSFLKRLFRSDVKAYIVRKRAIENETITIDELLNIAYYKFTQVNGTFKQFKDGLVRFLELK